MLRDWLAVRLAGALALVGAAPGPADLAYAQTLVRVTAGEHPTFGRVVLDAPGLTYSVERDYQRLLIRFAGDPIIGALPGAPRDVETIQAVAGGVALTLAPGADVHVWRMGDKVVIDASDPSPGRAWATPGPEPPRPMARDAPKSGETPVPQPGPPRETAAPTPPKGNGAEFANRPSVGASAAVAPRSDDIIGRPPLNHAVPTAAARAAPPDGAGGAIPVLNVARGEIPASAVPSGVTTAASRATSSAANLSSAAAPAARVDAGAVATQAAPLSGAVLGVAAQAAPATRPNPPGVAAASAASTPGAATVDGGDNAGGVAAMTPATASVASPEVATVVDQGQGVPPPTAAAPTPSAAPSPPADTPAAAPARDGAQQVWPVTGDPLPAGPAPLAAVPAKPPGNLSGTAIRIPFTRPVGAAMFSRSTDSFIVFDERWPIDLVAVAGLKPFDTAVVSIYPRATVLRLTPPAGQSAILYPARSGWLVSVVTALPRPVDLTPDLSPKGIAFAAGAAARVVTIADPDSGATLLVGTQLVAGQGVLVPRATAEFLLPPTGQGIVVEPLADAIALRVTQTGFLLSGGPAGLALSPTRPMSEAEARAARLTRIFEFPRQSIADLAARMRRQAVDAATAAPRSRGPRRVALAQSMIGLGLGVEARTVLAAAMRDDPTEAASPATIGLAAIAALLAHRPEEATDLADPRLSGNDEIALWRAIQTAMADPASPAAAATLATTAPLLFTYPDELAHRVLPLAMETMIRGGQTDTATALLAQRPDDPALAYARALLLQAQGDNVGALKAFEALSHSRSDYDHARAAARAVELRLALGQLDAKGAADGLEALLFAWRGDRRDLALRLRIADLRGKSGEWRQMFAMLRGARADFPDQAAEIDRRLRDAFAAVPRDPALARMPPTDLVALLDENAELMPDGPDGEPMRQLLAEKLMALDLPKQADPLLTKLMRAAPPGPARAGFGTTLATLRLREDDADGALQALSESDSPDMDDTMRERRLLITARIKAKRGEMAGALDLLTGDQSPAADAARVDLLEQARNWTAARDALTAQVAKTVPAAGMLDATQRRLVLRLATDATHAGDDATLAGLRGTFGARVGDGRDADMFHLLTEAPVRGTADLARSRAEMGLARAVSTDLAPAAAAKPP